MEWSQSPKFGLDPSSPLHILRMFPEQLLIRPPRKTFAVCRELGTSTSFFCGRFIFKVADGEMEYLSSLQAFICLGVGQGSRNALYQPQEDSRTAKVGLQRPSSTVMRLLLFLQNMGLRAQYSCKVSAGVARDTYKMGTPTLYSHTAFAVSLHINTVFLASGCR